MTYEKMLDALENIVCYNCHEDFLRTLRDEMKLHYDNGYRCFSNPFDINEWHTEEHFIYMLLVGMFGDWGTSVNSGWIDDIPKCIVFINTILDDLKPTFI